MYDVSLINLDAEAHSAAAALVNIERPGLADAEMRILLRSFGGIDAVENAVAEPEIRVKIRNESYLIRTGQKRFMLYDVAHRELPAHVLTLDAVMAELDGSGQAARNASIAQLPAAAVEQPFMEERRAEPAVAASRPRLIAMGAAALGLLFAIAYLQMGKGQGAVPATFHPVGPGESAELQSALRGVYMTGFQPGCHGIVITEAGDLKLFELDVRAAPRVIRATGELGRVGAQLTLATDQPGGLIEVTGHDTLVYCGEVYRRIP